MKDLGRHSLAIDIRRSSLVVGVGFTQETNNLVSYLHPAISCATNDLAEARVTHGQKGWSSSAMLVESTLSTPCNIADVASKARDDGSVSMEEKRTRLSLLQH